jgi:hypothetical protein
VSTARPLANRRQPRSAISDAIQPLQGIRISADVGRLLVHWLGQHAEICKQRYGCAPEGLADVQYALAEACAADSGDDSRQREFSAEAAVRLLPSEHDVWVDTAAAAVALGCKSDNVRDHRRRGNLVSRKVGRQHMISVQSIDRLKSRLAERST